jgi:hypothetical protein
MTEQRAAYILSAPDLQTLIQQLNFIFGSIADRLDQAEGIRGTPTLGTDTIEVPSGSIDLSGLGSIAYQDFGAVSITGGTISGVTLSLTSLVFTGANGTVTINSNGITLVDNDGTTIQQIGFV